MIEGSYDDPDHPTKEYGARNAIWSKANNWGPPVIGKLPAPEVDPAPLRLHSETGGYPAEPLSQVELGPIYWYPPFFTCLGYDNFGNLLGYSKQRSYPYVTTAATPPDYGNSVVTHRLATINLCSLNGSGLTLGPRYPDSFWTATRATNETFWSINGGGNLEFVLFPDAYSWTSPSGRTRVEQWPVIYSAEDLLDVPPPVWYQGEPGDPFKTIIFQNAAENAISVNSWDAEPVPPPGSMMPYRQGPLFTSYSGLATLSGSGPTAQWRVLKSFYSVGGSTSVLNDRGEVLQDLFLWRNNRYIDLRLIINANRPSNHSGFNYSSNVKTFINNQGLISVKDTRWFGGERFNHTVLLLPVDVVDANNATISKLKVGKMIEDGVISVTGSSAVLNIDKDPDRFFIRVVGGANFGGLSLKVSTTDNPNHSTTTPYNDNATQIDLVTDGADAISKSMLLVADDADDDHPVDGIADDAVGDRTHKVQLGGKFKIEEMKIGSEPWLLMDAMTPVPAFMEVQCDIFLLKSGGTTIRPIAEVETEMISARERFAQVGVKVVYTIVEISKPLPVDLTVTTTNVGDVLTSQVKSFLDGFTVIPVIAELPVTSPTKSIQIFYVNSVKMGGANVRGVAICEYVTSPGEKKYVNNVFISNLSRFATTAHEIGHILTNRPHVEDTDGDFYNSRNLMVRFPGAANTISAAKRLDFSQENLIKQSAIIISP